MSHVVTLHITGARTEAEAKQVAKAIAHSPLCKTSWSSADPNWGRLLAAAGYSGVEFDPAEGNNIDRRPTGIRDWDAVAALR